MAFITKKHLPRRTFLRGVGATIALPLLDSMVAAQTPIRKTAAAAKSRLSCIYVPHGATMDKWTPGATGKGFEFTEILSPLEKFRDRVTIVSNLAHAKAGAVGSPAGARFHPGRRDHRSDRCAADRSGHTAPIARALD
jgi:hypothetical protein